MIEFDSFCYLQNQKTGCSMVEAFLRQCCSEGIVRYEKHRAPKTRKPGKFYFTGVREPLDTYLSLFNYGLDGKGELFERLRAGGQGGLYAKDIAGFVAWLDFVLDANHAALVYPKGCAAIAAQLGLVSLRFLRLAALGFEGHSKDLADPAAIRDFFAAQKMTDAILRYESLQGDLLAVVEGPLRHAFADLPAAQAWIAASPRINPSTRRDKSETPVLPAVLRKKLKEREWYLYQTHYPKAQATDHKEST